MSSRVAAPKARVSTLFFRLFSNLPRHGCVQFLLCLSDIVMFFGDCFLLGEESPLKNLFVNVSAACMPTHAGASVLFLSGCLPQTDVGWTAIEHRKEAVAIWAETPGTT